MRSKVAKLLAFSSTAFVLGACAEDVPNIYIEQAQTLDDQCQPEQSNVGSRSQGVLDVFIADEYIVDPLIRSTLVPSTSVEFRGLVGGAGGLQGTDWEASLITLTRATVELDIPDAVGVPVARSFDIPISGSLEPVGQTTISLQAVSPPIVNLLRTSPLIVQSGASPVTILARIRMEGRTSAGVRVGSNEFSFPIQVCYGCLLEVPPSAVNPALPTPNCLAVSDEEIELETICRQGQDRPVDCRLFCPTLSTSDEDLTGICRPR